MGVVGGVAENRGQWRRFGVIWSIGASCGGHWAGSDLGQGEGRGRDDTIGGGGHCSLHCMFRSRRHEEPSNVFIKFI